MQPILTPEEDFAEIVKAADAPNATVLRHASQQVAGIEDGEHYVPKNCRSICASLLIAANVPTVVVKDFLGHESVATTETYYCNTKPALRAAANARKERLEDEGPNGDGPKGN